MENNNSNNVVVEDDDEREEGEIVDDFEFIISSDEEYTMRQRIKELEDRNDELERIAKISGSFDGVGYGKEKDLVVLSSSDSDLVYKENKKEKYNNRDNGNTNANTSGRGKVKVKVKAKDECYEEKTHKKRRSCGKTYKCRHHKHSSQSYHPIRQHCHSYLHAGLEDKDFRNSTKYKDHGRNDNRLKRGALSDSSSISSINDIESFRLSDHRKRLKTKKSHSSKLKRNCDISIIDKKNSNSNQYHQHSSSIRSAKKSLKSLKSHSYSNHHDKRSSHHNNSNFNRSSSDLQHSSRDSSICKDDNLIISSPTSVKDSDKRKLPINKKALKLAINRDCVVNVKDNFSVDIPKILGESTKTIKSTTVQQLESNKKSLSKKPIDNLNEDGYVSVDSLEENELRLIALKSAYLKKHLKRKARQAEVAYSPTDFEKKNDSDKDFLALNNQMEKNDIEDLTSIMDISPLISPKQVPSPVTSQDELSNSDTRMTVNRTVDTKPVDMDIAVSDSSMMDTADICLDAIQIPNPYFQEPDKSTELSNPVFMDCEKSPEHDNFYINDFNDIPPPPPLFTRRLEFVPNFDDNAVDHSTLPGDCIFKLKDFSEEDNDNDHHLETETDQINPNDGNHSDDGSVSKDEEISALRALLLSKIANRKSNAIKLNNERKIPPDRSKEMELSTGFRSSSILKDAVRRFRETSKSSKSSVEDTSTKGIKVKSHKELFGYEDKNKNTVKIERNDFIEDQKNTNLDLEQGLSPRKIEQSENNQSSDKPEVTISPTIQIETKKSFIKEEESTPTTSIVNDNEAIENENTPQTALIKDVSEIDIPITDKENDPQNSNKAVGKDSIYLDDIHKIESNETQKNQSKDLENVETIDNLVKSKSLNECHVTEGSEVIETPAKALTNLSAEINVDKTEETISESSLAIVKESALTTSLLNDQDNDNLLRLSAFKKVSSNQLNRKRNLLAEASELVPDKKKLKSSLHLNESQFNSRVESSLASSQNTDATTSKEISKTANLEVPPPVNQINALKSPVRPPANRIKINKPYKVINKEAITKPKTSLSKTTRILKDNIQLPNQDNVIIPPSNKTSLPLLPSQDGAATPPNLSTRLLTNSHIASIKVSKLVIQLNGSDSETSDGSETCDINEYVASNSYFDNASPLSLPLESASNTPKRVASPVVVEQQSQEHSQSTLESNVSLCFEQKVDSFLKSIRSKCEAKADNTKTNKISTIPPKVDNKPEKLLPEPITPLAVRHLPSAAQNEYRRLVHRMKLLEKQKQSKLSVVDNKAGSGAPLKSSLVRQVLVKNSEKPNPLPSKKTNPAQTPVPAKEQKEVLKDIENEYHQITGSLLWNVDKNLKLVALAKKSKINKFYYQKRIDILQEELRELQEKADIEKKKMSQLQPEIRSQNTKIANYKDKMKHLHKTALDIGTALHGTDYSLKHPRSKEVKEKLVELSSEIKNVNSIQMIEIEKLIKSDNTKHKDKDLKQNEKPNASKEMSSLHNQVNQAEFSSQKLSGKISVDKKEEVEDEEGKVEVEKKMLVTDLSNEEIPKHFSTSNKPFAAIPQDQPCDELLPAGTEQVSLKLPIEPIPEASQTCSTKLNVDTSIGNKTEIKKEIDDEKEEMANESLVDTNSDESCGILKIYDETPPSNVTEKNDDDDGERETLKSGSNDEVVGGASCHDGLNIESGITVDDLFKIFDNKSRSSFTEYSSVLGDDHKKESADPFNTVCPFEVHGQCIDEDCEHEHFKKK